ncbi:MAG: hypothetical protein NC240_05410 [Clostridium sp.]|nr:hypothetical protein [Clostridium sp.]
MTINTDDKRKYFQGFHAEILTSNQMNHQLIQDFSATDDGEGLEYYLKNYAWSADLEGETKVYLVKDLVFFGKLLFHWCVK